MARLGGDFRQILPVVPRGRKADVIAATLNQSQRIWGFVRVFKLHANMRVQRLLDAGGPDAEGNAAVQQSFASFLKSLGNGTALVYPDRDEGEDVIRFPPEMCCDGDTLEDLIKEVYGDLAAFTDAVARSDFITKRAILTPRNADVDLINKVMVDTHDLTTPGAPPAQRRRYLSADSVVEGEGVQPGLYPTDFLNKLEFSGVPPHEMHLQEGCPIILLRNMPGGLANGTRLIVTKLTDKLIKAEVATGPLKGKTALIPRLSITPSDSQNWPFTLRRRQFPVRPAFAMTINKGQGQTFERVGLYLPKPVFSHGQLYVGASRVGSPDGLVVSVPGGVRDHTGAMFTRNVVYREVLLRE